MEFVYQFNTSPETESRIVIDVEDQWVNVLQDLDRKEYNNDHRETRRHCSLDAFNLDGNLFPSDENVEASYSQKERNRMLYEAIEQLPQRQKDLIITLFFEESTTAEYAKRCGVTPGAITQRKATALKKLKKILEKT